MASFHAACSLAGVIAYLSSDMSFAKLAGAGVYVAVVCSDPPHSYAYTWAPMDGELRQKTSRSALIPLTSMAR